MCVCVCVCVCGCQCVEPGCVDCVYTDHREGPCHRDTATRVVLLVSACTPTIERARVTETQLHVLFCLCRRVHRPSRGPVSPRHSYTCCRSACVGVYTDHREGPCHRDTATRVVVRLVSACTPTIERARVTETQLHVLSFGLCPDMYTENCLS